ncbi:MAG: MFS transporter [Bryobacterales bacterium]|nr:MFS transporter [Bryobacterales bacterium]
MPNRRNSRGESFPRNGDSVIILLSRSVRLFGFGAISVILVLHLKAIGYSESLIGQLLALTMAGDAVVTLWVTLRADRFGRARMLRLGAALMMLAGAILAVTNEVRWLAPVMFFGAISLNGGDTGPFLAIEQAALTHSLQPQQRTSAIAWYILSGSLASAVGSLAAGVGSYRAVFAAYAMCGAVLWILATRLSPAIEAQPAEQSIAPRFGLHRSRSVVLRLSALFALDTFGSGLAVQSFLAYWLHRRFGIGTAAIGTILFGMNGLAAFSALAASRLAARVGLINTMVWTHIPANILLMALPFVPSLPGAVAILLLRGCLSQMDVPARQSYLMAVVDPDERSAAGGITGLAKSIAGALSPPVTGALFAGAWLSAPFAAAGALKIVYDLLLWRGFRALKPPEEC